METGTNECPVSIAHTNPGAMELVHQFIRLKAMSKITTASLYGGDLSKWPSRLVDAMIILEDELSKVEELFMK